ncbi:MAG: DUF3990 domain-containing protein [Oscillospiraceae bacterium]|nr:DUF3990 domain-containing protein [Oscillospiraceae bacterium]
MIVYHGSNMEINNIDLSKCRKYKDFGQGFYVTTLEQQAIDMAKRVVRRSYKGIPTVTIFEFDESRLGELSIKKFERVNEDWAIMVINNRNEHMTDIDNELTNQDNKYDIVYGPVANDDISTIFALYVSGFLKSYQLAEELAYRKLNNQYSFHTERAIKFLTKVGVKFYDED